MDEAACVFLETPVWPSKDHSHEFETLKSGSAMYLEHFQLTAKPFQITSNPKFLWLGEKHKEALATLRYGILDNRGFLLLTGEVGIGKTLLINHLLNMLDQDTIVATLPDPDLDGMDFYNLLADGLRMNRTFDSKGPFLIHLRDFLYQSHANNKQVLLIIDECQRLKHHQMEDIRILSNIELQDRKLINIFFVGQHEFNAILSMPQNRALAQRITVRYNITPLEKDDIPKYIFHRLRVAGGTRKIFTAAAMEQIFYFSGGIPRLINILCDHALLTGYARGDNQIDEHIIKECADELRIPIQASGGEEIGSLRAPDSASIADAAAKAESPPQELVPSKTKPSDPAGQVVLQNNAPSRSLWRMLLYGEIVILIMFLAGFVITHFSSEERVHREYAKQDPVGYATGVQASKSLPAEPGQKEVEQARSIAASRPAPSLTRPGAEGAEHRGSSTASSSGASRVGGPSAKAAASPALGEIKPLPLIKEKSVIRFALNSNEIENQSYQMLDRIAAFLKAHPRYHIDVRGFTDSNGSSSYNESVSRFRAGTVKSYLVGRGVLPEQIKLFAMGDHFPIDSNTTVAGRARNRRVEIEFEDLLPGGRN
jgi:general secretion pathway protein A